MDTITQTLEEEKARLQSDLDRIDQALTLLNGNGSTKTKAKTAPGKAKQWDPEDVTCPDCGFVSVAPQGLSAHRRAKHEA